MGRRPRGRRLVRVLSALALPLALGSCADDAATVAACQVDNVVDDRLAACPSMAGAAELPDLALPCLGGEGEMSLAAIEGPAVVNFWGSWCGPCREEMPIIERFHDAHTDDVAVMGVAIDTYPAAAAEFLVDADVSYPSLLDGCGEVEASELALGRGLPQTIFVAADGSIVRHSGAFDSVAELVELSERHLGIDLAGRV